MDVDPLRHRVSCVNPHLKSPIKVVTYNILADSHATRCAALGWYDFSGDSLTLERRHRRLMEEVAYLDGDVLCFQEVSDAYYRYTLKPDLQKLGYEGAFIKRQSDQYDEGEATFWRTGRLQLVKADGLVLSDVAQEEMRNFELAPSLEAGIQECAGVAMVTQLKCVLSEDTITVANIHVMYDHFKRPDLQCVQVACAIRKLVSVAGDAEQPHIICGDFNSWPGSPTHVLTRDGHVNDQNKGGLKSMTEVTLPDGSKVPFVEIWPQEFRHTSPTMKSAYYTVLGQDPISSRFPSDGSARSVDFIWFSGSSLQLLDVLKTAPEEHIKAGIPNDIYPSDHVSLRATFAFK